MPKWIVANVYVIRCGHEIEAPDEEIAVLMCLDADDDLDTQTAEYWKTVIVQEPEKEG